MKLTLVFYNRRFTSFLGGGGFFGFCFVVNGYQFNGFRFVVLLSFISECFVYSNEKFSYMVFCDLNKAQWSCVSVMFLFQVQEIQIPSVYSLGAFFLVDTSKLEFCLLDALE